MLREISIEIIRKCPNNCLHCSSLSNRACTERLPYDKFMEVVSDAKKLGAKTICLSGGEPFLHNRIIDMIRLVSEYGMDCYVYTSGIVLDSLDQPMPIPTETLKQISGYAAKLIFNIEAGTEQTYDRIMGTKCCFKKMHQSAVRAASEGLCTEAHFVPMKINMGEMNEAVRLCEEIQISKLSFLRLVLHGRAKENAALLTLTERQTAELKNQLSEFQAQSNLSIRIGVPLSLDLSCHKCEAARGKLNIKYDGSVFPCEVFKNFSMEKSLSGLKPESIYQQSLLDIYNHSQYLYRVREMSERYANTCGCETCIGQHLISLEEREEH